MRLPAAVLVGVLAIAGCRVDPGTTAPALVDPDRGEAPTAASAPEREPVAGAGAAERLREAPIAELPRVSWGSEPIRINVNLSYTVDRPDVLDRTYVLEPDGSVLQIVDPDIYAGADRFRYWNVGPDGHDRLIDRLREFAAFAESVEPIPPDPTRGRVGRALTIGDGAIVHLDVAGLDADPSGLSGEQIELQERFRRLLVDLDSPAWAATKPIAPELWVPDHFGVKIRNEYDTRYYTTPDITWPFADSLSILQELAPGEETTLCLFGEQAQQAWSLFMVSEVNNARLPISIEAPDGTLQLREAGVIVNHPLYRRSDSPCPAIATID